MIALGAEPITPPAPAEAAWHVHCLRKKTEPLARDARAIAAASASRAIIMPAVSYTARIHLHTALALGPHLILTPAPGPAAGRAFIDHIRQHTIRRLQGTEAPAPQMPFLSVYPAANTMKHQVIKYADSIIYQVNQIRRKVNSDAVTDPDTLTETLAVLKKADDQIDDILTTINFPVDFQTLVQGSITNTASH